MSSRRIETLNQRLATQLMRRIVAMRGTSLKALAVSRILLKLRQLMIHRCGDPLIRMPIYGTPVTLNLSHELPRHLAALPQYGLNLGEVAQAVAAKYPGSGCIDIGANIGDSAVLLRRCTDNPILCIEGDTQYFSLLRTNTAALADVTCEHRFVHVDARPVAGSLSGKGGTARLEMREDGVTMQSESLAMILARHPRFQGAKLLKTDTDGLDTLILKSSAEWLAASKPVIFTEFHPVLLTGYDDDPLALLAGLRESGYDYVLAFSNQGPFLFTTRLSSTPSVLDDWYWHFRARGQYQFFDLCLFHADDSDLAEALWGQYRQVDQAMLAPRP